MSSSNRVVTVTINPAIDQTILIPNFAAGTVNRVQSSRMDPGGKGINVASCLADFGQPVTATGFLGAENDDLFRRLFAQKAIEDRCVRCDGATRIGVKISDLAQRKTTGINFPGPTPSVEHIAELFGVLRDLAADREWFVLSGSIPAGVPAGIYREMIDTLAGKKVVLDTSGEGFRQAVTAGPWIIKPNVDELEELVDLPLTTPDAIVRAARQLMQSHGIAATIVSMGKEGAIFVEDQETVWVVPGPADVKSTVGAGDAMVAGVVAGKIQGLALAECARLATAFSVAAIGKIGSGLPSVEAVQEAREKVIIRRL